MQLTINIRNKSLVNTIIKLLEVFKDSGVEIREVKKEKEENTFSDDYLKKHWREFVMNTKSEPNYYKSEEYYQDRGEYLMEKYK